MSLDPDDGRPGTGSATIAPPKPPAGGGKAEAGGGGAATAAPPKTGRGRDWAALRQFSVFLENRVGILADLLRTVEGAGVRVVGLSIQDNVDSAVARFLVDDYERATDLLKLSDFCVFESDVVVVQVPDDRMTLTDACRTLLRAELNVHYAYTVGLPGSPRGGVAMYVDDVDLALDVLANSRYTVVTEGDLKGRFD